MNTPSWLVSSVEEPLTPNLVFLMSAWYNWGFYVDFKKTHREDTPLHHLMHLMHKVQKHKFQSTEVVCNLKMIKHECDPANFVKF